MENKLLSLIVTVALFGVGYSDDLLSDVFSDINTMDNINKNNMNNMNRQAGGSSGGGLLVNLRPNGGGMGGGYLGGNNMGGGVMTGGFDDSYFDDYGYGDDKHVSSIADLVNVVFGLGGHIVGRAGWIVRDALGALIKTGDLVTHSLDMGLTSASMVKRFMSPGLINKLIALQKARRLMKKSRILKELRKPLEGGKMFDGKLFGGKLSKLLSNIRDGMAYSNYRLGDDDFGLMSRSLGGLRGYGGLYGTSKYPSYYNRFAYGRDDD